nr:hypothetical protein [Tanacetum cinerariifolium]
MRRPQTLRGKAFDETRAEVKQPRSPSPPKISRQEANYEILESLLKDRRIQTRNEDLRAELEYDEEREMESRRERTREITPPLRTRSPKGDPDNFLHLFRRRHSYEKMANACVHNIKQRDGESLRALVTRYTDETLQILGLHKDQSIFGFVHGLRTRNLVEHLSTYLPSTYKCLMEKTYTWIKAKEVATNRAPNEWRNNFERSRKSSWDSSNG